MARFLSRFEEAGHISRNTRGGRRLIVHLLPADWPRDNLHRAAAIVAPVADGDFLKTTSARGEECRVPAEQPVGRQGLRVVGGCVEHHLDDALDIAVGRH